MLPALAARHPLTISFKLFQVGDHIRDILVLHYAGEAHFRPRHQLSRCMQVEGQRNIVPGQA